MKKLRNKPRLVRDPSTGLTVTQAPMDRQTVTSRDVRDLASQGAIDWQSYWAQCGVKKAMTKDQIDQLPTAVQKKKMAAAIRKEIKHLERCHGLLIKNIDTDVFLAGTDLFDSEEGLALWLCDRAPGLGGKLPLVVMRTARGRREVANLLLRLSHGIY